jgi:predicted outer membrane protein
MARWTVVLAVLTGLAAAVLIYTGAPASTSGGGWTSSVSGPVGPADRAVLVAVRQATLWEVPAVQQTELVAASPEVRRIGGAMVGDLSTLSEQVRTVADRLGVVLPSQPTAQQQMWSTDLSGETGPRFDAEMVGYLYQNCEATLAAVASARERTENSDIRALTQMATKIVGDHLRYLAGTGLVNHPT